MNIFGYEITIRKANKKPPVLVPRTLKLPYGGQSVFCVEGPASAGQADRIYMAWEGFTQETRSAIVDGSKHLSIEGAIVTVH